MTRTEIEGLILQAERAQHGAAEAGRRANEASSAAVTARAAAIEAEQAAKGLTQTLGQMWQEATE